jgi:hypothetical protein
MIRRLQISENSPVSEYTSDAVAACPQDYCVAFASHLANNRTGSVPDGKQPTDEKWQGVHDKAFVAPMKDHSEPAKHLPPHQSDQGIRAATAKHTKRKCIVHGITR